MWLRCTTGVTGSPAQCGLCGHDPATAAAWAQEESGRALEKAEMEKAEEEKREKLKKKAEEWGEKERERKAAWERRQRTALEFNALGSTSKR